jgi:signal transduction histidine kinase
MRRLPLLPIAPLVVVIVSIASAALILALGVAQVKRTSEAEAGLRADTLAETMAARLRFTPFEDRAPVVAQAAQGADTEMLLVEQDGKIVVNASLDEFARERVVTMLVGGTGAIETASGRQRFSSKPLGPPLEHLTVVAMVAAPVDPPETSPLVQAVLALTALLVGVAAAVAFSYARAAHDEVDYVRRRIEAMAATETEPTGKLVPIRSLDEIGVLTAAFNTLVGRFAAAERSYRADLIEAAQVDQERLEFLAGLSHELRTPLNAILGFSHVLESEVDGPLPADARESVEIIRTSGEHLRTLIDDILDLSALETGELKLSVRPLDLRRTAEDVARESAAIARAKGIELHVTGDPHVLANADRRRVRQILTNLVANAIKFTSVGSVTIDVEEDANEAVVRVIDTGPGVAESEREAIFEAYRQSADTRMRAQGTGLGLATVKRLVLLHGGFIHLDSTLGRGSTFTVRLPLATAEDVREAIESRGSLPSVPPELVFPRSDRPSRGGPRR